MDYKITLFGNRLYKEIKLGEEFRKGLLIGTAKECQIRFFREQFFTDFLLRIFWQEDQWIITCEDSVYLKKENQYKEYIQRLSPQDVVSVCYDQPDMELFRIELSFDFGNRTKDYNRMIQCGQYADFTLGGLAGCSILIEDDFLQQDYIRLVKNEKGYLADTGASRYGISLNGFQSRTRLVQIQERDIFSLAGISFYYKEGVLYTSETFQVLTDMPMQIIRQQNNHLQYPKFIRSARQQFEIPDEKIDILPPKNKQEEPKKNIVMSMVPMLLSMGMMGMMRATMGGGKRYLFMCVGMGSVSIIMAIINYRNEGLQYRKNQVKRENDYNLYIAQQEKKIQEIREKERIISRQKFPTLEEHLQHVQDFDARLFEKLKEHEDYLWVRLGSGIVPAKSEVSFRRQEYREIDDPLMDYPEKLNEKYKYIDDMPVMVDLQENNVLGFIGDRNHLYQMAKNLIVTLATEHYYQDVRMFLLMDEQDKKFFDWARWFANTSEENGIRNFMYDEASSKIILEYLYAELSRREGLKKEQNKGLPTYIIFVYRSESVGEHPISQYIERADEMGFVFLFFEEYVEKVNQFVKKRIFLHNEQFSGYIQDIHNGEKVQVFQYPHITMGQAAETALKLGCVYVDEVSLEANLTKNITLYELFHILNAYELDIEKRWASSKIYESMAAPIGVKSGDEVVALDLHEKYHGPHGLVAGTTGSGKSEILQTYILSMATYFHPYEVGFIIIDFKGGGMVNQFRDLPHLNGAITNIDGDEINRSLSSIKAELQKRQRLFAEQDVNHIDDYIRLFKQGTAKTPLPHLILIVDEFAELKSEQPEFMKELISAARIGRSLGVHLILATQKPSGVVNDQIWSNSKFKLCLKVQNKGDSNEVLKSPLAAEIREPGRAYLQVGNNEIFQLFQSAYSGAPIPNSDMGVQKKFKISEVDLCGSRRVIYEQKPKAEEGGITQLDAIVDYIQEYCKKKGIRRLPNICLPSLAETIPFTCENYHPDTTDIVVPIGMYDDPDNQLQDITDVNFTQGHIIITGSSQYGKTNLLQTMIRGLADNYTSDEVHLYILDFASMIMKNFEKLNHVGGVILSSEDEKIKTFYKMMQEEMEHRKDVFSEMGLSSFSAYRDSGMKEFAQIIIMIENIGAVRELYPNYEDNLLKIAREGAAVGICLVVSCLQCGNLGYRYLSNFPKRIAMYNNDSGEYSALFERCRSKLKEQPGRCLLSFDKKVYEGQVYLAFPSEREIDRVKEIRSYISERNQKDTGKGATVIPVMPDVVTKDVIDRLWKGERTPYDVALGIGYADMDLATINLSKFPLLGISGAPGMGRTNYIQYILSELIKVQKKSPVEIYIIDGMERRLGDWSDKVTYYSSLGKDAVSVISTVYQKLSERHQYIEKGEMQRLAHEPLELVILNSADAYNAIAADLQILNMCKDMLNLYRKYKMCIMLTNLQNTNIQYNTNTLIKFLHDMSNLIVLRQIVDNRLFDVSIKEQKQYPRPLQTGEAYFKCGGFFGKFKLPIYQPEIE